MDKINKRSSSASDDDAETKKHKKSDVDDSAHASSSESLKSGKRVLEACSERNANLKEKEMKSVELTEESFEEAMRSLEKFRETRARNPDHLEMFSLKEEETEKKEDILSKKKKKKEGDTCCFDCEDAEGTNSDTIFVKGFERLCPRNQIKKMLSGVFGQCGELRRVFVPMECDTRLPLGFAFINYKNCKDQAKALELNGRTVEGKKLKVTMASEREEYYGWYDFGGCDRCIKAFAAARSRNCYYPNRIPYSF